ncbi:hypothetical protein PGT21_003538 [Puccinia graminis f. sp. tritici]|uniref:Secreted protein n=1 Tax=Puccinia graminis f. sp. tritici TaxID=56615 RepID=A0A5B0PSS7_PUCGR|nr:hypothetical protein PGT21_003538 [Puccinia graminis f. sp. tritici]
MRHFGLNFLVVSLSLSQAHGNQYQPSDASSYQTAAPATVISLMRSQTAAGKLLNPSPLRKLPQLFNTIVKGAATPSQDRLNIDGCFNQCYFKQHQRCGQQDFE